MLRDLRLSLRMVRKNPSFAGSAILVMALGIGASTAVFSVLRGVLLEPLPYRDPGRIVLFRADLPDRAQTPALTSVEFAALRGRTDLFESVAAAVVADANLVTPEATVPLNAAAVSANFLETLGVVPLLGRSVGPVPKGAGRPVAIGYEAWQRYFRGDPNVIGTPIDVNGAQFIVAGVLPREFRAYLGADVGLPPRLDLLQFRSSGYDEDPFRGNIVIGRLRPGVTLEAARTGVELTASSLVAAHAGSYRTGPVRLSIAAVAGEVVKDVRPAITAAAAAVLLVLVVACANLTNILLARASGRSHEIAVRIAIGARRRDITRQLVAEGLVIGLLGAAAGWALAQWGVDGLLALAPTTLPRREAIVLDATAAVFAVVVTAVIAIIVSIVPAWHTMPARVARGWRTKVQTGRVTRGLLVAGQLAFSVMLLVGSALLARAFVNLRTTSLGFEPADVISMHVSLDGRRWNAGTLDEARVVRRGFYERLLTRVEALPGVHRAGAGFPRPFSGMTMTQRVSLGPGSPERETDGFIAFAGYLETLGVALVEGRYLTPADHPNPVVVIDERLAQQLWPGESAIGRRLLTILSVSPPKWTTVIGVVSHVNARSPREPGLPQIWMTYAVRAYAQLDLIARVDDPAASLPRVAAAVIDAGAGRPVRDAGRMEDDVSAASADTRFALFVLGVLSALAVLLSAVGVYGVVSYTLAQQVREIAVRVALGASPTRLVGLVLRDAAAWAIVGIGGGLALAALLSRSLESLLFGVTHHDGTMFLTAASLLVMVVLTASIVPALRAVRVDPMIALRRE